MTRDDVVAAVRGWIGTKWRHQGRTRLGIDCVGLTRVPAIEHGLTDVDYTNYPRDPDPAFMLAVYRKHMIEIVPVTQRLVGDVILLRDGAQLRHAGILSEKHGVPHLIHATARTRKVVEEPLSADWESRLLYVFRYPGIV